MKRRILALFSVLPLVAFLLLPEVALWSSSRPWTESSVTLDAGDFIAPEETPQSPGDSTLFLRNGPDMTVCKICRSAYALCALRSVRCTPCFRRPGFRVCFQPLLRVDAPEWAKVHAASAKSGGCGTDQSRPQEGENTVRRTALLIIAVMAAVLVVASGVAQAKNFVGTERGQRIVGTKYADRINALRGDDVVLGYAGPDRIRGGDDNDQQYGGRGNDIIYSEGGFSDLVNCGGGADTAYVDSKDRVVGCKRKR